MTTTTKRRFVTAADLQYFKERVETDIIIYPQITVKEKRDPDHVKILRKMIRRIDNTIELMSEYHKK